MGLLNFPVSRFLAFATAFACGVFGPAHADSCVAPTAKLARDAFAARRARVTALMPYLETRYPRLFDLVTGPGLEAWRRSKDPVYAQLQTFLMKAPAGQSLPLHLRGRALWVDLLVANPPGELRISVPILKVIERRSRWPGVLPVKELEMGYGRVSRVLRPTAGYFMAALFSGALAKIEADPTLKKLTFDGTHVVNEKLGEMLVEMGFTLHSRQRLMPVHVLTPAYVPSPPPMAFEEAGEEVHDYTLELELTR
jgi:hypothetical protein